MRPPERPHSERGAALLTVLMLVAIVAVLAGTALERLRLSTRLAGNAANGEQARAYAEAAETLATTRITGLLSADQSRVSLIGGWSGRPFGLPLPGGGTAIARVTDGGNCFNLNGLVTEGDVGVYATNDLAEAQFVRLMRLLDIPAQAGTAIAASTADWIDSDQDQQSGGAEDQTYLARATPYRTAGTLMSDPSELRAIDGMTPDIYARLRPWVCTLPKAEASHININTLLPEQAPLAAMLFPESVGPGQVQAALVRRPPQGFSSVSTFLSAISSSGGATTDSSGQFAITTKFFALTIDVSLGGTQLQEHALIDASRLPARLVSRQWGGADMTTLLFLPSADRGYRWMSLGTDRVTGEGEGRSRDRRCGDRAVAPADAVTLHWAELPARSPAQATAAARLVVAGGERDADGRAARRGG